MGWIHNRRLEQQRRHEEWALIEQEAEAVYNLLWEELQVSVKEAREEGFDLGTNGAPWERVIAWRGKPSDREPVVYQKELRIRLNKAAGSIVASGYRNGTAVDLKLVVGSDNVVGLSIQDGRVTMAQAARLILEPFLFPSGLGVEP